MKTIPNRLNSDFALIAAYSEILGEREGTPAGGLPAGYDGGNSSNQMMELCHRLETQFYPACACGLAQQIGRCVFSHLLRQENKLPGLTDRSFRLMPGRLRLLKGFGQLEKLMEKIFGIPVTLVDAVDDIQINMRDDCVPHDLIPHLEAGFIQEFIHWVSGGKPHLVSVKDGNSGWTVVVGKQPLDA
jgi:hypothetical protein